MGGPVLGLLTIFSLIGLGLNLYILAIVLLTKQVEGGGGGRVLIGHLGFVGSLLCALFLASSSPAILNGNNPLIPCPLAGSLFILLHPLALYTLCGLNCDRYVAITAPLHYASLVKPRKVAVGLAFAWILSLSLSVPPLFLTRFSYNPGLLTCTPDFTSKGALWYSVAYTALTLILPATLIMACNLKVLMIARYHRHRIARAIFEVTLSAQVTITHQKNPFLVASTGGSRSRSASVSVLQLVGSLLLLYVPYYCLMLWQSVGKTPSQELLTIASGLLALTPPLNGLLYGLKNKLLRRAFRHYWRKKMTKSELDHEIQARTPSRRPSLTPQRVWRPVSTGMIGNSNNSPRTPSLRHSATSTSILTAPRPVVVRHKPKITVTRAGSVDEKVPVRIKVRLGGSSSSVSGDSDVTQEDWGGGWTLAASSSSLPARTDDPT